MATSGSAHESLQSLDVQIATMNDALCALKKRRNALLLINQLPNELLEDIIVTAHALEVSKHIYPYPRTLYRILLVCNRWSALASSSHRPWSLVDLAYRDMHRMAALSGSRTRTVWAGGNRVASYDGIYPLQMLAPSVQTLLLDYGNSSSTRDYTPLVSGLLQCHFTSLTRLEVSFPKMGPLSLRPPANRSRSFLPLPCLRHLALDGLHPSYLNPWNFADLITVDIGHALCAEDSTPLMQQIAAGCTSLKKLFLRNVGDQSTIQTQIHYPCLEELLVTSALSDHLDAMIGCLGIPSSCALVVLVTDEIADPTRPQFNFAPLVKLHKQAFDSVCFDHKPFEVTLHGFEESHFEATMSFSRRFRKRWQHWDDVVSVAQSMWDVIPLQSLSIAWLDMPSKGLGNVSRVDKDTIEQAGQRWDASEAFELLVLRVPEQYRTKM